MPRCLVLVRHGESEFNARNLFTGWADPPLTARGVAEAQAVADHLGKRGISPDAAFCSALRRSAESVAIIFRRLGSGAAVVSDAALNERNYGDLTALNKDEAAERWGSAQVRRWRRSYDHAPPAGESLRDTAARVLPYYIGHILPAAMRGCTTLVVAHGNSLRALVMALDQVSPEKIPDIELATGEIRLYELAQDTTVSRREILSA